MMNEVKKCDPRAIERYLDNAMHADEESLLMKHLNDCGSCQKLIQAKSGSDAQWIEAATAFQPSEFDAIPANRTTGDEVGTNASSTAAWTQSMLSPSDNPRMLGRIGTFEVSGCVGIGGMGVVFKARDSSLDRYVAVKALAPHLASSRSARERFAREAKAAAAVVHDNVIAIHQVSQWQGLPYLVMPYLTGPSLQQRLDRDGPMQLDEALRVALQVAEGLAAAHAQGLVHRDVIPANILLCGETERAVLTDFGLARAADDATLSRIGSLAGTPQYMAPEQARGESVDASSDLFSLGSVIFAMLTGHPPVQCDNGTETIHQVATVPPTTLSRLRHDLPDWVSRLVSLLHSFDSGDRIASTPKAARLLSAALAHVQQPDTNALPIELGPVLSRRWFSAPAIAGTFVALIGVLAILMQLRSPTSDSPIVHAASATAIDVQAAIDLAMDGETVLVPAGTATWKRTLKIDKKGITLQGSGIGETIILADTPAEMNQLLIRVDGHEPTAFRISGFSFCADNKKSPKGLISIVGTCKKWRIDNCRFERLRELGIDVRDTDVNYGVIDHCEFTSSTGNATVGIGVRGSGDASWQRPLTLGTAEAVYVESCKFDWEKPLGGALAATDGARYVFRHNDVIGTWIFQGGMDTSVTRATFSGEVYGNSFSTNAQTQWTAVNILGGTGVVYDNSLNKRIATLSVLQNTRSEATKQGQLGKRGITDGSNAIDGNEEPNGYPCCDQVGRTTDSGLGTRQKRAPVYCWSNLRDGNESPPIRVQGAKQHIRLNRDYFVGTPRPGYAPLRFPHPQIAR